MLIYRLEIPEQTLRKIHPGSLHFRRPRLRINYLGAYFWGIIPSKLFESTPYPQDDFGELPDEKHFYAFNDETLLWETIETTSYINWHRDTELVTYEIDVPKFIGTIQLTFYKESAKFISSVRVYDLLS